MAAVIMENPNISRFMEEERFSKPAALSKPEAKPEGARPLKSTVQ